MCQFLFSGHSSHCFRLYNNIDIGQLRLLKSKPFPDYTFNPVSIDRTLKIFFSHSQTQPGLTFTVLYMDDRKIGRLCSTTPAEY
jgi:hypothetical protein